MIPHKTGLADGPWGGPYRGINDRSAFMKTLRAIELPVSGLKVRFRAPDGNDDLAIVEAAGTAVERALAVLPRLAEVIEQVDRPKPSDTQEFWAALTVTDFEIALLGLRRFLFGDTVSCLFRDSSHPCGERMELEFSITAFLEDICPTVQRGVERATDDPRWFRLTGPTDERLRFRLPSVEDQLAVIDEPHAESLLARRCIDTGKPRARTVARVEHVMEAMAPLVSRPLTGKCPECGEPVTVSLHVARFVMDELQRSAAGTHEQIDAIAAAYHWNEGDILAMPERRRRAYAEMIERRQRASV
jgi:hypothetical protein